LGRRELSKGKYFLMRGGTKGFRERERSGQERKRVLGVGGFSCSKNCGGGEGRKTGGGLKLTEEGGGKCWR